METNKKINVAELLKDCPSGMELDCTICDNVYFDEVTQDFIKCYFIRNNTKTRNRITFNHYGDYLAIDNAKCVIFPKGKTTWDGFQRPFKDGEVVAYDDQNNVQIFIFKDKKEYNTLSTCYLMLDGDELYLGENAYFVTRIATEEEKAKLFKAIKANGCEWNPETKTLKILKNEYPKACTECCEVLNTEETRPGQKFEVGDIVYSRTLQRDVIIREILPNGFYKVGVCGAGWFKSHEDSLCKAIKNNEIVVSIDECFHIFKDENGNVINTIKIVLGKKKKGISEDL